MENVQSREPWNKGKLLGQKPPLKLKDIMAIHSKLRGYDLVSLRIRDVSHGGWFQRI
jgi:hypothetical protein